jgi:hypothetical protein
MSLVKLNWKPAARELRSFGAIFMGGFVLIGLVKYFWPFGWLLSRNETLGFWLMAIGVVVGAIGLTGMRIALPFYWVWLGIAYVMGNIMSRIIITLLYYLLFTPMRLLGSVMGRNKLQLKKTTGDTYWHDIPQPKSVEQYERQF